MYYLITNKGVVLTILSDVITTARYSAFSYATANNAMTVQCSCVIYIIISLHIPSARLYLTRCQLYLITKSLLVSLAFSRSVD